MSSVYENITIDLRQNKIMHINLSELTNSDLTQIKELIKVPTVTVQLENNPVQCDCDLLDFIKFPKEKAIKAHES